MSRMVAQFLALPAILLAWLQLWDFRCMCAGIIGINERAPAARLRHHAGWFGI